MNIEKLARLALALALALAAAGTGQLPKLINTIRQAQVRLVQETKASKWPKAPMLKPFKKLTFAPSSLTNKHSERHANIGLL